MGHLGIPRPPALNWWWIISDDSGLEYFVPHGGFVTQLFAVRGRLCYDVVLVTGRRCLAVAARLADLGSSPGAPRRCGRQDIAYVTKAMFTDDVRASWTEMGHEDVLTQVNAGRPQQSAGIGTQRKQSHNRPGQGLQTDHPRATGNQHALARKRR
jgi:hypothetical protein